MERAETRTGHRMHFVEGEGWHVTETAAAPAASQPVPAVTEPPRRVVLVATDVPLDLARQVIELHGLKVVNPTEISADIKLETALIVVDQHGFKAFPSEVIEKLPKSHQETLAKAARREVVQTEREELLEKVKAAATMEELDQVLDGVTDPEVIKAAEEKAAELAR